MFVVVTEGHKGAGFTSHLLVNFSSVKIGAYHDPTCVVLGGRKHHSFLRNQSYIEYRFARIEMASDLASGVSSKKFQLLAPVSSELLARIRKGILKSSHTPLKCQRYFEKNQ